MTYLVTPQHKNSCARGHEIYNLGRPFLGHQYYILSFSNLCMGVEEEIFKEIMHFYIKSYMAMSWHKNPCHRGHEMYNFGRPFLGHHYYILGFPHGKIGFTLSQMFQRRTCLNVVILLLSPSCKEARSSICIQINFIEPIGIICVKFG